MTNDIEEALGLVDNACTAARKNPANAYEHYTAALRHTGALQRALILQQLTLDPGRRPPARPRPLPLAGPLEGVGLGVTK